MGFDIQKHGPILAVLGVAFYLGWPPAELEDYGAGPVKAKAVRWKVADLVQPRLPSSLTGDPFAEVLINPSSETVPTNTESNPVKTEAPSGPTKQDFLEGLKLGGVAEAKSNRWAIINGRIRREGDQVKVIGLRNQFATIDRIEVNRVVVSLDNLSVSLKQTSRQKPDTSSARLIDQNESSDTDDEATQDTGNSTSPPASSPDRKDQDKPTPDGMQRLSDAFKLKP